MLCTSSKNVKTSCKECLQLVKKSKLPVNKLDTIIIFISEEEEEEVKISKEVLEAFFQWLKDDGLPPKKSERLWQKTITAKLLNQDKMTLDNYQDFLKDYHQKLESKKSSIIPIIDPKIMVGISLKYGKTIKKIQKAVNADSYIHLFFQDESDELVHKSVCQKILESQP